MNERQIKSLLQRLPPHAPPADFTARTLRRLDEVPSTMRGRSRLVAIGVLVCSLLLLASGVSLYRQSEAEKQAALRELRELRAEYMRVQHSLQELRNGQRLVYLGGTDQAEYVVDLGKVNVRQGQVSPLEY